MEIYKYILLEKYLFTRKRIHFEIKPMPNIILESYLIKTYSVGNILVRNRLPTVSQQYINIRFQENIFHKNTVPKNYCSVYNSSTYYYVSNKIIFVKK